MYFPFSDRISDPGNEMLHHFDGMKGFENSIFKNSAEYLLQKGYAFDFVSDKQLQKVKVNNLFLQTSGVQYETILLAATKYLPRESLQQLLKLAADGATILIEKGLPVTVPGWGNFSQNQSSFNQLTPSVVSSKLI